VPKTGRDLQRRENTQTVFFYAAVGEAATQNAILKHQQQRKGFIQPFITHQRFVFL